MTHKLASKIMMFFGMTCFMFFSAVSAAAPSTPKLLQGAKNMDDMASASGSAIYGWCIVIGLVIFISGACYFAWASKQGSNAPQGAAKHAMIACALGAVLSLPSTFLYLGAEMMGATENVSAPLDYRDLENQ